MPEVKEVTYTLEIDAERYKSLPFMAYGGATFPQGSFETTAEILLAVLGKPPEILDNNESSWREGNYRAILSWLDKLDFDGTFPLYSIAQPSGNPINWTVKSQIRGLI